MTERRRRRAVVGGVALAAAVLIALATLALALGDRGGDGLDLRADPVSPSRDAPRTAGTAHDGTPIDLPASGRPALVTFLFTRCPDICPLATGAIRDALDIAGPEAEDAIDVVAVSVDPDGDTRASVDAFLTRHRMQGRMSYLTGTEEQLRPLWEAWLVAAQPDGEAESVHSARIVLVDRRGRQVGDYPAGVAVPVDDLAADLATLARED